MPLERLGYIYVVLHMVNKKAYVGQTVRSLHKRWMRHVGDAWRGSRCHIARAIRKYGAENFIMMPLYLPIEESLLDTWEQSFIREWNSIERGYNLTEGGDGSRGFTHSAETRTKMSAALKGQMTPEKLKEWARTSICTRWNIRRGKLCTCGNHTQAAAKAA